MHRFWLFVTFAALAFMLAEIWFSEPVHLLGSTIIASAACLCAMVTRDKVGQHGR